MEVLYGGYPNNDYPRMVVHLMKYPIEVHMSPAITKSTVDGKTYAVAGRWVEVPDGTTLADVHKYVTHVRPQRDVESWQVLSSSGSTYTISRINGETLTCSCPGFGWRKKCKHTAAVAA
jgi:hypothetical protein